MSGEMNRRELVQLLAGAALVLQLPAAEPGAPLFFTKDEFALLDRLTDLIIPTDEHSPGAREAGVAAYIDRTTAEAFAAEDKETWRKGLQMMNALSVKANGAPFLQASREQQVAVLSKISKNEENGQTPEEEFWGQIKQTTALAYYSSSIGIHKDMNYKGNVLIREFVGYDAT
jgi:hypothetical protein